jgi:hypothetical protein
LPENGRNQTFNRVGKELTSIRLRVSGGRDEGGEKLPALRGFTPATGRQEERPFGAQCVHLPLLLRTGTPWWTG